MSRRFKWVSCQFDFLRRCPPERIQRALEELPETLDGTYERTLQDIDEAIWDYAHRLFQCIAVASRPFRVEELAEFLVFDFEAGLIPKLVESRRRKDPIQAVLSTCSSLISVVEDSQEVQFSHFSVREFLISRRLASQIPRISRYHIHMTPAHTMVAQACLSVLLHLDENLSEDSLKSFPLAQYAAQHWIDHAQLDRNNVPLSVKAGIKLLFDPRKPHFTVWIWIFNPDAPLGWQRPVRPSQPPGTPLHFAALYGICDIAEFLIVECAQDVKARRLSDNRTPLFVASERGHAEVTQFLLQRGAAANDHDLNGGTPLHLASERGHLEVARNLLIHGADSNSQDNTNSTPLHLALQYGRPKIAEALLEYGADVNSHDKNNRTPLHLASERGYLDVAQLLLNRGADAEARDKNNTTPMHIASQKRHLEIAELLLSRGADANTLDENGRTPLHLVSGQGYLDVAQLLLDRGADAKYCDKDGTTPLHLASQGGRVKVARLLLSCGADPDTRGKDDQTALHLALRNARRYVSHILFNINVTAHDGEAMTCLQQFRRYLHGGPTRRKENIQKSLKPFSNVVQMRIYLTRAGGRHYTWHQSMDTWMLLSGFSIVVQTRMPRTSTM
jgi:ankyrin repeat protein